MTNLLAQLTVCDETVNRLADCLSDIAKRRIPDLQVELAVTRTLGCMRYGDVVVNSGARGGLHAWLSDHIDILAGRLGIEPDAVSTAIARMGEMRPPRAYVATFPAEAET